MNKKRYNEWMLDAERVLHQSEILHSNKIYKSYNGQVAALGVSIVMSGVLPTIAIYYQDYEAGDEQKAHRRYVLDVIAQMVMKDDNKKGKDLFEKILNLQSCNDVSGLSKLKADIIDCSVALKKVIRTYNLVNYGEKGEDYGKE